MISKKFKVKYKDWSDREKTVNVISEEYSSMAECINTIAKRPLKSSNHDCQYMQIGSLGGHSREWLGFDSIDDFMDICKNGLHNTDKVKNVMRYANKAMVEEKDKLTRKVMDVAGGGVDVPLYLSGTPECMMGLKRAKVRSKVIKATVNCEVLCDISVEDYTKGGLALAKAVTSLEKAGYRVRLQANGGVRSNANKGIAMLTVTVKRENEPCNFRRLLMPMLSTAFWRGTTFNWISTLPGYDAGRGLGQRMDMEFPHDQRDEKMEEILRRVNGEQCVRFNMNDIIRMVHSNGVDSTESYLKAKMMELR